LFERKVKATDRTKTPEEIAREGAERLHELETRRLARMNGDFDQDDFSDISDDEGKGKRRKKSKSKPKKSKARNPDELDDSDNEEKDNKGMDVRFTADGLVYIDKDGNAVKKVANKDESDDSDSDASSEEHDSNDSEQDDAEADQHDSNIILAVGTRVHGNYRVKEQYGEQAAWYDGVVTKVNKQADGSVTYDVTYDDNDFEEDMEPKNVCPVEKTPEEKGGEETNQQGELALRRKRQKAKEKARYVWYSFGVKVQAPLLIAH
jgi:nucleolar protein 14